MTRSNSSDLAGADVLVTGASGFIGSHLCRRLVKQGARVHGVSRSNGSGLIDDVQWWKIDLSTGADLPRLFDAVGPRVIYHLASHVSGSRSLDAVAPTFESNLASTLHLLRLAAERGVDRIILAGSMEEPEGAAAGVVPASPYAASKWAASAYGRMFHALYETPVVLTRIFMVYGPAQRDLSKLIPYVTLSLLRGEPLELSSGTRAVDWIYVDDVVEGLVRIADASGLEGSRVDLGSGTTYTIREVVDRLVSITVGRSRPQFGALDDRPMEQERVADLDDTRSKLGWAPEIALEEGLRRTVAWYAERMETGTLA